jgi:hypothetical protein
LPISGWILLAREAEKTGPAIVADRFFVFSASGKILTSYNSIELLIVSHIVVVACRLQKNSA